MSLHSAVKGVKCQRLPARRHAGWPLALVVLSALAALACGAPYHLNGASTARSAPYWACATPTPRVPDDVLVTPEPAGTPYWATVEPPPTATPYYRLGEFYQGQSVTIDALQIRLLSVAPGNGYTLVRLSVTNHGKASTVVALSQMIFASAPDGETQVYSPAGQGAAGLPDPALVETAGVPPDGTFEETLAVTGQHDLIGLATNLFGLPGGGARAVWFHAGPDPVGCPDGEADWPVPLPRASGYGYLDMGALLPALPDTVVGPVPLENYIYVSQGYSAAHHGIDLSANSGEPIYTPIAGTVYYAGGGWNDGYGNLVIVRAELGDDDYLFMYFAHMESEPLVAAGDTVHCGQHLGYVGSTGHSTGPHLHWEARRGTDGENSRTAEQMNPEETRVFWPSLCGEPASAEVQAR